MSLRKASTEAECAMRLRTWGEEKKKKINGEHQGEKLPS